MWDVLDAVEQTHLFPVLSTCCVLSTEQLCIDQWRDVTACEFYAFLASIMLMVHARKSTTAELLA